ncbi:MAG: phage tail tape measure protein [Muribaculaceae bacterium]|nr:phage tail tape measure protein [Muribaculaceae bacterium]MBR6489994.1 phage tail tape measure protein [Muribaculaceae bacterium]
MSDYQSTATSTIYVNGKPAEDELRKLKERASDLRDAIAAAGKAGNKADLSKFRSELKSTNREIKNVENSIHTAENVMKRLNKATPKELNMALKQLKKELNDMERGSDAWNKQVAKIKLVKKELDSVNAEMREQQGILSRLNDSFNKWGMSIAGAAAALTGLTMTVRQAVDAYAEMDQEMANVRKYTGMEAEDVEKLNEEFKKMDTRTAREDLNKLAQEAGRLGKSSQEDVLGFVKAADKINVALDELGDGATLTLSKITGIFGEEKRLGTEKSLLAVGSVINELSQNCRASAPYLAEFAQRMAGVGSQSGMTIQQIMGFGAVLDSNGQKVESSATALGQVITKLYKEPAKYAKAAGLDVKEFTDLLKNDANAAVIQLLETLNNAGNMDALAPMFKEMGENGARSISTLATLAKHIEEVKEQQQNANIAFAEATSIDKEFNVQNNTVQAGLEKAKNNFHEMAVTLGEKLAPVARHLITGTSALMRALAATVDFVVANKTAIIALTAAIVAYTIAANAAAIKTKLMAAAEVASRIASEGLIAAKALLSSGLALLSGNVKGATQSFRIFSATLKASPIGLAAAAVTALAVAMVALTSRTSAQAEAQKNLNKITEEANKNAVEQKQKIELLMAAAGNLNLTYAEQTNAVNQLNKIIPGFNGRIDKTTRAFTYSKKALEDYNKQLVRLYELEGAKEMLKELGRKKAAAIMKREGLKAELAKEPVTNGNFNYSTSQGGAPPPSAYMPSRRLGLQADINATDREIAGYTASEKAIMKEFGSDMQRQAVGSVPSTPTSNITGGGGGGGGSHGSSSHGSGGSHGGSSGSSGAQDIFAEEKAWRERFENELKKDYAERLISFEVFTTSMQKAELLFYKKQLEHKELTDEQRASIEAQYAQAYRKFVDGENAKSLEEEEDYYREQQVLLDQSYIDGSKTLTEYNDEKEKLQGEHLLRVSNIYRNLAATDETYLEKAEDAEDKYRQFVIAELIKTQQEEENKAKEHQEKMEELKEKYFGLNDEEKKIAYDNAIEMLDAIYQAELAKLGDNQKKKLELEKKYLKARKQIYDGIYNAEAEKGKENAKNWQQWTEVALDKLFGEGTWEKYGDFIQSAYSSIMSSYQNLNKLIEAGEKEKLAAITKKYDAEIRAAEGNKYRIVQIEKRKAAEEKQIKDAANQRAMAMELAQAVSGTALAAINAYASAAKVAFWLGPIAAGLAIAAGMVQIAAIKKSHDAQAQGYSEGGFTKPGAKDEPAGIVHAGEWVASQKLLASPVARPVIEALDYAQRTNTIGRLGTSSARRSSQQAAAAAGGSVVVTESQELRDVIKQLTDRLNEPFVTINTVSGPHGIDQAQKDYNKLMNNTLPKNKRI